MHGIIPTSLVTYTGGIQKITLVPAGVYSLLVVLVLLQTADPYAARIVERKQLGLPLVLPPPVSP